MPSPWVVVVLYQICGGNTCMVYDDGNLANMPDSEQCMEQARDEDRRVYKLDDGRYIKSLAVCIRDDRYDKN